MDHSIFVKKLRSLASLSDSDIVSVQRLEMRHLTVARRTEVLPKGARPSFVYVLLSGWAARYEVRRDGTRRITGFLLPGDFCGIHAVCEAAMDHAITAITDCVVGAVERDVMGALARASKPIFDAVWRSKLIEEAILRKWLLYAADARQGIGRLLCELYTRMAMLGLADDGRCEIPLTQEEIGDALGLTSVHVNRMLQSLRTERLIELSQRQLTILDGAKLHGVAEFESSYLEPWVGGVA